MGAMVKEVQGSIGVQKKSGLAWSSVKVKEDFSGCDPGSVKMELKAEKRAFVFRQKIATLKGKDKKLSLRKMFDKGHGYERRG